MTLETVLGLSVGVGTLSPWSRQSKVRIAIWKRATEGCGIEDVTLITKPPW
jgi:hypothetical protein